MLYQAIGRSMLGRYAVYIVNLLSMMLLARVFTPEVFGTVASIMVFFTFFQLMTEVGLGPAIINITTLRTEDRNGIFGLTLLIGIVFSGVFYLLSPIFLVFYQLPKVDVVVPYVAISLFFFSATIVPSAFLLREQAYFRIANAGLTAEVVSTIAVVLLANLVEPLHALSAKAIFSSLSNFFVQYYFCNNSEFGRPWPGAKFKAIKPLLSFSGYQFGFNFINYFSRNLDNILIGKYLGSSSLGVYDKAYQLMKYPLMLLTFAMTPAIQPVIRKYANDKDRVEVIHRSFTFKLSLLGAIAGFGVFLCSDLIVKILLGHQWMSVIPIIKILAISIPVQIVLSTSGSFFQAMNRTDLLFLSGVLSAVVTVSAIVWGIWQRDMLILAWSLVMAFHINFLQSYYIMYKYIFRVNMFVFFIRMLPAGFVVSLMFFGL